MTRRIADKLKHVQGREWEALLTPGEVLRLAEEEGVAVRPYSLRFAKEDTAAGRSHRRWVYATRTERDMSSWLTWLRDWFMGLPHTDNAVRRLWGLPK
jgi:hypothetical protein